MSLYCALDVETIPMPRVEDWIEPVSAPSNYKDEDKINVYIREKTAEQIDRCSLDVDLCELAAIGWQYEDETGPTVLTRAVMTESQLLSAFWSRFAQATRVIGWNIFSFDVPVLERRSMYLGVTAPTINVDRYRSPHIDLQELFSYRGKLKWRSLDFYARRLNLDLPEDDYRGSDVQQLARDGKWLEIASHCGSDIRKVMGIAARLKILKPATVPA